MSNEEAPRRDRSGGPQMTAGEAVPNRVTAPGDIDRARRRWRLAEQVHRRRISLAFDWLLDVEHAVQTNHVVDGDYWRDCGMHLGVAEREAAA